MLTDARYFQGSFDFLQDIRAAGVACPLLCKEFIVEAYQLYKARACVLTFPHFTIQYHTNQCMLIRASGRVSYRDP